MKTTFKYALSIISIACCFSACSNSDDKKDNKQEDTGQNNHVIVENTSDLCSDNLDNDNDGKIDCADSGCADFAFCDETEEGKENTLAACMDFDDNDGDGATDCDDTECKAFAICQESQAENTLTACQDGKDNDKDSLIDCNDPECQGFAICNGGINPEQEGKTENDPGTCLDGEDNDGDGKIDCADEGCKFFTFCPVVAAEDTDNLENTLAKCTDGVDNDNNGLIDCLDPNCREYKVCAYLVGIQENTRELCSDDIDNDYNGVKDKDDDNCRLFYAAGGQYGENTVAKCKDKQDNDEDGVMDCEDPECQVYDFCMEGYKEADDECKDDPYKFKKDTCACGQTLVGSDCYTNIVKPEDFDKMANSSGNFILKQDIEFGETKRAPILGFTGTLDGNNKRITGVFTQKAVLSSETDHNSYCGLFGAVSGDTAKKYIAFKNIDLAITLNCYNDCTDNTKKLNHLYVGGLCASLSGSAENIKGSSKVYVEELFNSKENNGQLPAYSFSESTLNRVIGGLFGHTEKGTLSHIVLSGNVSAYLPISKIDQYKPDGSSSSTYNSLYVKMGGVAGTCNELHDVHADNYMTLKRSNVFNTYGYYYYGSVCGQISWTPQNTTDVYAAENVSSRGVIRYLPMAKNYSKGISAMGGIAGYVSKGGIIKNASFQGVLETNKIRGDYNESSSYDWGLLTGGIVGNMVTDGSGRATGFDSCHTHATFRLLGEFSSIGGIVGVMRTDKTFVRNSSTNIDLELLNPIGSATESGYYGGIIGRTNFNKTNYAAQVYILNNSARTNYIQTTEMYDASKTSIGGVVGNAGGIVVNNFVSDTLTCAESCSYIPKAVGGGYVYESYWNLDVMGSESGADKYSDASAEPYTFNAAGVPVTRTNKTVLGLLRYNSGHDGGVLSAHIPANIGGIYNNWTIDYDKENHEIPVPTDE